MGALGVVVLNLHLNPRGGRNKETTRHAEKKSSICSDCLSVNLLLQYVAQFYVCFPSLVLPFNSWMQAGCVTAPALGKHSQMNSTTTNINTSRTKSPLGLGLLLVMHFMAPSGWVGAMYVCVSVCGCVLADNCVWEEEAILTSTGACASGEVSTHEATWKMKEESKKRENH